MSDLPSAITQHPAWAKLDAELAAWSSAGLRPTFWWRDDDAIQPTVALDRMLALSQAFDVPLALAIIPAQATSALGAVLKNFATVTVAQHGFAHINHARTGERASEFGPARTRASRAQDVSEGAKLMTAFPNRASLLVPPWNRIERDIVPELPQLGVHALSCFGPRAQAFAGPGVREVNCHCDIVAWKSTRGFVGVEKAISMLVGHLEKRRQGLVDATEPTGLLTHHLVHDEGCWIYLETLFRQLDRHPTALWLSLGDILK